MSSFLHMLISRLLLIFLVNLVPIILRSRGMSAARFLWKASAADNRDTSSSSSLRSEKAIDVTVPLHQRTVALSASALALSDPARPLLGKLGFGRISLMSDLQ